HQDHHHRASGQSAAHDAADKVRTVGAMRPQGAPVDHAPHDEEADRDDQGVQIAVTPRQRSGDRTHAVRCSAFSRRAAPVPVATARTSLTWSLNPKAPATTAASMACTVTKRTLCKAATIRDRTGGSPP